MVYQSKWRQVRNMGLGLSACFIGVIFVCRLFNMYAFIPEIFLIFYLSIFFRQIKNKKIVLLNTQGIYYYNTSFNNHSLFIPWNKIKKIKKKQIAGQWYVSIYLVKDKHLLAGMSKKNQKKVQMNKAKGYGAITIDLYSAKNCTNDELIKQMNRFRQKRITT